MIEIIALSVVVIGVAMGALYAVPRVSSGGATQSGWPDVMGQLEGVAQRWLELSRVVDIVVLLVGLGLLIGGFQMFEEMDGMMAGIGALVAAVGLLAILAGTHVNVRRSGLYSAEATLIGMALVGLILLLIIAVGLVDAI